MKPRRRNKPTRSKEDPMVLAISTLTQAKRDLLMEWLIRGQAQAEIAKRKGAQAGSAPRAMVDEARELLIGLINRPRRGATCSGRQ
jgi:hypothetical protein